MEIKTSFTIDEKVWRDFQMKCIDNFISPYKRLIQLVEEEDLQFIQNNRK